MLDIAALREDYRKAALDEATAGMDPLALFGKWMEEAFAAQITEVNAMTLATADEEGRPHARIVLLKGLDEGFVFYTNYGSAKAAQIAAQPYASLLFFWKELERQVRIEGFLEKVSAVESDTYFQSRPYGSRIGAWASPQSAVIPGRSILEANTEQYLQQFGKDVPRPEHWGGYRLRPLHIEFWQGRSSRLHDRLVFARENEQDKSWQRSRLAP